MPPLAACRDDDVTTEPTDHDLWEGLRDAVEADFATLFRRHHKVVYNYAFRSTASWSQAEDLTQATFTALWRRAREGSIDPLRHESAVPVLISMARHEVLNNARGRTRRLRLVERIGAIRDDRRDEVDAWVAQEGGMARVREVLETLPDPQREVIELVVWSHLDMAECARVLGVPVGTVKSRLSRARQRLATSDIAHLLGEDR